MLHRARWRIRIKLPLYRTTNETLSLSSPRRDRRFPNSFLIWSRDSTTLALQGTRRIRKNCRRGKKKSEEIPRAARIPLVRGGDTLLQLTLCTNWGKRESSKVPRQTLIRMLGNFSEALHHRIWSDTEDLNRFTCIC